MSRDVLIKVLTAKVETDRIDLPPGVGPDHLSRAHGSQLFIS